MPNKISSAKTKHTLHKQLKSTWQLAICEYCNEEYSVPKRLSEGKKRQRFCSLSCVGLAHTQPKFKISAQKSLAATKRSKLKVPKTPEQLIALRQALNLRQAAFWERLGIAQSTGSRYENGRLLPPPVVKLLDLIYIKQISPDHLNENDSVVLELLKTQHPDLYASISKTVRGMDKLIS